MPVSEKNLGRLQRIDLREVWETESGGFTPWLAKKENLALLGEALGMELELESQERSVGAFRADILCRDAATNDWIVIENQLECTDHGHLGQLFTYTSGLKAKTLVWIARQFTEEHRAALTWLNDICGERLAAFGIEIELWRIGDSPIAPKFNIVCQPNEWSERVLGFAEGELSERKLLQQEYWAELGRFLRERGSSVTPQKPLPQHWTNFAIGRAHFGMSASVNMPKAFIKVGVECFGSDAKAYFALLERNRDVIEQDLGYPLEWERLPNRKQARIASRREDVDVANKDDWPAQHLWMAQRLESLHRVFAPRIRELDLEEQREPDAE